MLFLGFVSIVYKRLEDANNTDKNLKAKIYYMALKTMLQHTYYSLSSLTLRNEDTEDIVALFDYKDGIDLMSTDGYKKLYYPVLADFMIDYKDHVFVTDIKANM